MDLNGLGIDVKKLTKAELEALAENLRTLSEHFDGKAKGVPETETFAGLTATQKAEETAKKVQEEALRATRRDYPPRSPR